MEIKKLHLPVLLNEVLGAIQPIASGYYADLTFGEGGHCEGILNAGAGRVIAIDRDGDTLARYRQIGTLRNDDRLKLEHLRLTEFSQRHARETFDGILIDLGVSTRQLLEPDRGFSFAEAGPLDMRMDRSQSQTLSQILGELQPDELADRLFCNTGLRGARGIARRIKWAFNEGRLSDTQGLSRLFGPRHGKAHPATVPFLALRMLVNDELGEIERGITPLVDLLKPGGRLLVITFHSTEDRAVKRIFQSLSGRCICASRFCVCPRVERVRLVFKKPVVPEATELATNPRSRSAKLRVVEKL